MDGFETRPRDRHHQRNERSKTKLSYCYKIIFPAALDQQTLGQQTSGYPYGLFFSVGGRARQRVKILFIFSPVQREQQPDQYPLQLREAPCACAETLF